MVSTAQGQRTLAANLFAGSPEKISPAGRRRERETFVDARLPPFKEGPMPRERIAMRPCAWC